jgi:dCMP deaminase
MKDYYMDVAYRTSELSRGERAKVGAIIVKDGNIISFSWNGTPTGRPNECEYQNLIDGQLVTKDEVLHAEENCIAKVAKSTFNCEGAILFCTHAPCKKCARLIIQSGIAKVWFGEIYEASRSGCGLPLLEDCGVEVEQYRNGIHGADGRRT